MLTKSTNHNVIEVYKFITEHEGWDSDYWNEDMGSQDLIRIFETHFSDSDWKALAMDLNNWTTDKLELFTHAILGGYSGYTNNGVYYHDQKIVNELTRTIPYRFDLLLNIIQIEVDRNLIYKELSNQIIENLDFINDHFEILFSESHNYLEKIKIIFELLNLAEHQNETAISLKNKIQKAKT